MRTSEEQSEEEKHACFSTVSAACRPAIGARGVTHPAEAMWVRALRPEASARVPGQGAPLAWRRMRRCARRWARAAAAAVKRGPQGPEGRDGQEADRAQPRALEPRPPRPTGPVALRQALEGIGKVLLLLLALVLTCRRQVGSETASRGGGGPVLA